ncbi:uncharacterized protein [Diadema setosum]|uniref:uncharacterized protein n=1 Tax=Diadema setosum TaxID=31175 RepID=UPI003B3A6342
MAENTTEPRNQGEELDGDVDEDLDEAACKSSMLFTDENCQPIQFFMRPSETKARLKELIENGGGEVTSRLDKARENVIKILAEGDECKSNDYYSHEYVEACWAANILLDKSEYRVTSAPKKGDGLSPSKVSVDRPAKGRSFYTAAEDKAILQYIAKHPFNYGGNQTWKKMEIMKITNHSWQSMKDRFRKKLEGELPKYIALRKSQQKLRMQEAGTSNAGDCRQYSRNADSEDQIEDFSDENESGGDDRNKKSVYIRRLDTVEEIDDVQDMEEASLSDTSSFDVFLYEAAEASGSNRRDGVNESNPVSKDSKEPADSTETTEIPLQKKSAIVGRSSSSTNESDAGEVVARRMRSRQVAEDSVQEPPGKMARNQPTVKRNKNQNNNKPSPVRKNQKILHDTGTEGQAAHGRKARTRHSARQKAAKNDAAGSDASHAMESLRKMETRSGRVCGVDAVTREQQEEEEEEQGQEQGEEVVQINGGDDHAMEVDDDPMQIYEIEDETVAERDESTTQSSEDMTIVRLTTPRKSRKALKKTPRKTPPRSAKKKGSADVTTSPAAGEQSIEKSTPTAQRTLDTGVSPQRVSTRRGAGRHREAAKNSGTDAEDADSESSPMKKGHKRHADNAIIPESEAVDTDSDVLPMQRARRRRMESGDDTPADHIPDTQVPEEDNTEEIEELQQFIQDLEEEYHQPRNVICAALFMNSGSVTNTRDYLTHGRRKTRLLWTSEEDQMILSSNSAHIKEIRHKYGEAVVRQRLEWLQ